MQITIADNEAGLTTVEAKEAVRKTIDLVGKLKYIEHRHVKSETGYETFFKGSEGEILLKGGFSSGYNGEGPSGLKTILLELGFNESIIDEHVFGEEKKFRLEVK